MNTDMRRMVRFPSSRVRILGSGVSFPICETPDGPSASIPTSVLLERLAPEMPAPRRAAVAAHLAEAVGVESRSWARWCGAPPRDGESDSGSLGLEAARNALSASGIGASDIAGVVFATSTPPKWTSAVAATIAGSLGAVCPFFDVRSGCAGGAYAIAFASMLAASSDGPVLAIGADTFSKALGPQERLLSMAMGDGAGALVIAPASGGDRGLRTALFGGDGALVDLASVPARLPPKSFQADDWFLTGNPERFGVEAERALLLAADRLSSTLDGRPDACIVHAGQASVCRRVAEAMKSADSVWLQSLARHGNVGAASLAVALHDARAEGFVAEGKRIAIASVGGGLSWAGLLWSE